MSEAGYPQTHINTVNRYRPRAKYDYQTINTILDACPVVHVGFNPLPTFDDPFPAVLPMIGCTGTFGSPQSADLASARDLYIHGYVSSRLMKQPSHPDAPSEGTPVCVSATLMDGLVLALTPNHHSCNFRSAIVHGYAHMVTDLEEKMYALELITNNMLPTRWENSRVPPTKTEMTSTTILRIEVVSASAKVRDGSTGEDRADLKNMKMREGVWNGVVPSWIEWGTPVPADTNVVKNVPAYVEEWRLEENRKAKEYAMERAKPMEK